MKDQFFKLTLVTSKKDTPLSKYLDFIAICVKSGITSVQLREKNLSFNELFRLGKQLQLVLKPLSIPLIINDNVDLAYQLGADGVHLGQSDGCVVNARRKLGSNKIIGLTVDSPEQLYIANTLPIDYVGVGAVFPSNNKSNVATIWGCEGLKKIAHLSIHPIVAIGGINETNASVVMQAGADGIAAIGAFHDSNDLISTTKNLRSIIEGTQYA
ncbi:MAG: thiamine phosphate synthase [Gammaproteobacteria bacterium]